MVVLDAAIHEFFAQKAACPLESVDASYPNKVSIDQSEADLSSDFERQTYSEKRKFWEDISKKRESYQRSESEVSRTSQLTINESDSESCLPNVVSEEDDGTTEEMSEVLRPEITKNINVPDISECSVAEKAHYFEEQIQKEMAKGITKLNQQDSVKSEKDKPFFRGKSNDEDKNRIEKSVLETKKNIDIEEKHLMEAREIEKILKISTKDSTKWTKEIQKETKDIDKKKKNTDEDKNKEYKEIQKIIAQPVIEICKELLNKEKEHVEEIETKTKIEKNMRQEIKKEIREEITNLEDIIKQKKLDASMDIVQELKPEESTSIYKMQKDGTSVQDQVFKSVQIKETDNESVMQIPEISEETKIFEKCFADTVHKVKTTGNIERLEMDIKTELVSSDNKEKMEQSLEEKAEIEEKQKTENEESKKFEDIDTNLGKEKKSTVFMDSKEIKKEFESRIPISATMAEKDKNQKEAKAKVATERLEEKSSKSSIMEKDIASPSSKKKEFESRIPKRITEGITLKQKDTKKDLPGRRDGETTVAVTEKKFSEEVTLRHSTMKSEIQTSSKTFTDVQDVFKISENMNVIKDKDFVTFTSKVDTKPTNEVEKEEVFLSEISSGTDKFVTQKEKEKVERKKSSESSKSSKFIKESSVEIVEKKKSKSEEMDKTTVQKISMDMTEDKEMINVGEFLIQSKKEELFKLEDKKGIVTEKSGTESRIGESNVDIEIKIEKDDTKKMKDIKKLSKAVKETKLEKVEMIAQRQSHKENLDNFEIEQFIPSEKVYVKSDLAKQSDEKHEQFLSNIVLGSLEKREQLVATEIEARNIAENLIQSIEDEIERRSSTSNLKPQMLTKEYLDQLLSENVGIDHEKLADDLTKKIKNITEKSLNKQLIESKTDHSMAVAALSKTSIQEDVFEKGSTKDSISINEDIIKSDSLLYDQEESLPSSYAKLQDRDITISPNSISEQIDLEETIDVDTGELEDMSKPTSSSYSEKFRSDRSSGPIELLQKDVLNETILSKNKIVSEISGARVLEILELDSRQDSVDVPSLELDEYKVLEQTSRDVQESVAVDSLELIVQEKDLTSDIVSEDTDFSKRVSSSREYDAETRQRADSFEIESPPLISPKTKYVCNLELRPLESVNWMIGDEKIEISETLQPSQVFNQELEEYESSIRCVHTSSQEKSMDQESVTKSLEEISVSEAIKEFGTSSNVDITTTAKTTKFTVIPVTESDFDSELTENKLDVTCQELVDTLQREHDAKTPIDEYTTSIHQSMPHDDFDLEMSITKAITEVIPSKKERMKDLTEAVPAKIDEVKESDGQIAEKKVSKRDISTIQIKTVESGHKVSTIKKEVEDFVQCIITEKTQKQQVIEPKDKVTQELITKEMKGTVDTPAKEELQLPKCARVDDVLKEWTETYLTKIKPPSEDYKRHMEKTTEKHDKSSKSTSFDTCAFKIKKDDFQSVDLSARYAITVLDQVVKKEIAEVKESLEAAKQDLIEELSENSQTMIQIKDSPSEFQFKLQPESIPNDLPFLYRPPSTEHISAEAESEVNTEITMQSDLLMAETQKLQKQEMEKKTVDHQLAVQVDNVENQSIVAAKTPEIDIKKHEVEETITDFQDEREDEDEDRPSPLPISRSSDIGSDIDSYSLAPPQPAPRRRHKPARMSKRSQVSKTSESEAELGSSSGESSNYQSCDYEIGSGSRPSSSDVEAMQSATGGVQSGTVSEYETAMMSIEHEGSKTLPTSQEYQTAASTLSSRESMKSLNSLSSGHLGSIDSTSELSETLVPSEEEDEDKDEIDDNLENALDVDQELAETSDSSDNEEIPMDETIDKIDSHIPCCMKRSSEMIFQEIIDDSVETELLEKTQAKVMDSATSVFMDEPGVLQSVDIMTSRVSSENGIQSVCTQVISTQINRSNDSKEPEEIEMDTEKKAEATYVESLEQGSNLVVTGDEGIEPTTSIHSMLQQASMSLSSASGMSFDTVIEKDIEKDKSENDSDSFEFVDKPDIIDDFVVIEEIGREAEEFDSEGKSIRISSIPQISGKQYDRDLENMITETDKADSQVSTSQTLRNNDMFDFESEESPPQASNDDQSQSYSDEEQYEGKKWIEMQFHADARVYDIEYDRGPLEDIKEEEITDFEAGSSRFGSLGSHKESIGSVGSMRGSFGSTPDYDVLGKKHFAKPTDHDNVSLTSLQEFEHLESAVAAENSRKLQCSSQDSSSNNGSLPRRYITGRSSHGDDISLSSLKDFEGLEKACREAHLMELRAREEEELLDHESPENKYKMENLPRSRTETSAAGSFNPSTSGSDDYEKRIKEIDEIIRIAQSNVEKLDRQDDTTEDISQIEVIDVERTIAQPVLETLSKETEESDNIEAAQKESNVMETSTDSLELEDNTERKYHPLCRSSDSLEMKTTLDFPSLSSDSLNNVKDAKEIILDTAGQYRNVRRISSDSLDMPLMQQHDVGALERSSDHHIEERAIDTSVGETSSTDIITKKAKIKTSPDSDT